MSRCCCYFQTVARKNALVLLNLLTTDRHGFNFKTNEITVRIIHLFCLHFCKVGIRSYPCLSAVIDVHCTVFGFPAQQLPNADEFLKTNIQGFFHRSHFSSKTRLHVKVKVPSVVTPGSEICYPHLTHPLWDLYFNRPNMKEYCTTLWTLAAVSECLYHFKWACCLAFNAFYK